MLQSALLYISILKSLPAKSTRMSSVRSQIKDCWVKKLFINIQITCCSQFKQAQLIYLLGPTGSGKSSLINYLLNNIQFNLGSTCPEKTGSCKLYPKDKADQLTIGNNPSMSETSISQQFCERDNKYCYVDTAGLMSTKGTIQEIFDSYSYASSFAEGRKMKVALVIQCSSAISSRGYVLNQALKNLQKLFKLNFKKVLKSTCVILTKASTKDIDDRQIKQYLWKYTFRVKQIYIYESGHFNFYHNLFLLQTQHKQSRKQIKRSQIMISLWEIRYSTNILCIQIYHQIIQLPSKKFGKYQDSHHPWVKIYNTISFETSQRKVLKIQEELKSNKNLPDAIKPMIEEMSMSANYKTQFCCLVECSAETQGSPQIVVVLFSLFYLIFHSICLEYYFTILSYRSLFSCISITQFILSVKVCSDTFSVLVIPIFEQNMEIFLL